MRYCTLGATGLEVSVVGYGASPLGGVFRNETLPALRTLRDAGKVRFLGVTGYPLPALGYVAEQTEIDTVLTYCRYTGRIPAGRWGRAEYLAGATVFPASAASDYVHGVTLSVDGGWMGR